MLSREYLVNRKECCGEGCQMCPYKPKNIIGSTEISQEDEDYSDTALNIT